jgi:hypothetical protein
MNMSSNFETNFVFVGYRTRYNILAEDYSVSKDSSDTVKDVDLIILNSKLKFTRQK